LLNPISIFLVSREVRCEDVGLHWLTNRWNNRRALQNNQRAAADIQAYSKKPEAQLNFEQWMDQQAESADQAKLNNLALEDAVQFSTVSLVLYQDPATQYTKFIKPPVSEEFGTSFSAQFAQSLTEGWQFLEIIILNLAKGWNLILISIIVLMIYHRFFASAKKPKIS
jgi:hypothetical protein